VFVHDADAAGLLHVLLLYLFNYNCASYTYVSIKKQIRTLSFTPFVVFWSISSAVRKLAEQQTTGEEPKELTASCAGAHIYLGRDAVLLQARNS